MQSYLTKRAFTQELITVPPQWDLGLIVVIPAFHEPGLLDTLTELWDTAPCETATEVIVVINDAGDTDPAIKQANLDVLKEARAWADLHTDPRKHFFILHQPDLPKRKAGVGLARKIGMDEAVRRFLKAGNPDGVIVCLDADCSISGNYFVEIESFFRDRPEIEGCSIAFAHALDNINEKHLSAIIDYELHLRYFIGMQRWAGFPFAYHTIGSSMAVRADVYCKVGGMNTRQAGEDFYFLHKVIERGRFAELNSTIVQPSPRASDRVPFGTGRSMIDQLTSNEALRTYHPHSFQDIRELISILPLFVRAEPRHICYLMKQHLSPAIRIFLLEHGVLERVAEIVKHTASQEAFVKRFFRWFNAFTLMKFCHFARDLFYPNVSVEIAASQYCRSIYPGAEISDATDLILALREIDRQSR